MFHGMSYPKNIPQMSEAPESNDKIGKAMGKKKNG